MFRYEEASFLWGRRNSTTTKEEREGVCDFELKHIVHRHETEIGRKSITRKWVLLYGVLKKATRPALVATHKAPKKTLQKIVFFFNKKKT